VRVRSKLDQPPFAGEADLERVFEHHRQQFGRGRAAEDRPAVAGGEQIGQPADVVDVHWMTRAWIGATGKRIVRRLACAPSGPASAPRNTHQLQPAVDQQRAPVGEPQLMAGAGDAVDGAVVENVHENCPLESLPDKHPSSRPGSRDLVPGMASEQLTAEARCLLRGCCPCTGFRLPGRNDGVAGNVIDRGFRLRPQPSAASLNLIECGLADIP